MAKREKSQEAEAERDQCVSKALNNHFFQRLFKVIFVISIILLIICAIGKSSITWLFLVTLVVSAIVQIAFKSKYNNNGKLALTKNDQINDLNSKLKSEKIRFDNQ